MNCRYFKKQYFNVLNLYHVVNENTIKQKA